MSNAHEAETDLVLLGARGKILVVSRTNDGFSVIVLDKADYERLAAGAIALHRQNDQRGNSEGQAGRRI